VETPRAQHRDGQAIARRLRLLTLGLSACALSLLVGLAPRAAAEDGAAPEQRFETLRQKAQARDQKAQEDFRLLVAKGKRLLELGQYDPAQRVLTQAAQLQPDDPKCRELLAQARRGPDRLLASTRENDDPENHSLLRQLDIHLFQAGQALDAGQPERARQHAQRVLDGTGYVSDAQRAARLRAKAQALLASAREAEAKARSAQQRQAIDDSRQRTARDDAANDRLLCRRGWELLEAGDAEQALAVARRLLAKDPANTAALALRQEAQRATPDRTKTEQLRADRKRAHENLMYHELDKQATLPSEEELARVVIPAERERDPQKALLDRPMEKWEADLREKLRKPITIELRETTLPEACRYLSQLTDAPILVDPAVAEDAERVTLPEMTVRFDHALRWLGRFCNVTYALRDHAILVTRRGGLLDEPVTREYDINTLLLPARIAQSAFPHAVQGGEGRARDGRLAAALGMDAELPSRDAIGEAWSRFIRTTVEPDSWGDAAATRVLQQQPQYTIAYRNGRIVVVHTPEVQEQVGRLLDNFRKARNLQVHILCRFIEINVDYLQALDVDFVHPEDQRDADPPGPARYGFESLTKHIYRDHSWTLVGDVDNDAQIGTIQDGVTATGGLLVNYSYLGDDEVSAMLTAIHKRRRGTLLLAPKLTCFNTQRANFQAVTNYNYVRSISADNEPDIGNVPDGIIFDVQPFVSADRRYITLVMQPQLRTLVGGQIPRFEFVRPLGQSLVPGTPLAGTQRWVQVPVVELKSIATTVTVPDGGTLLLGGLARVNESRGYASVPFIASIPILQYVFRDWTEVERRSSLIVLVTAQIVPDIFEE
jgi:Flp pilus assembly secretin CpaC